MFAATKRYRKLLFGFRASSFSKFSFSTKVWHTTNLARPPYHIGKIIKLKSI
ncbi:hypothetical protein [Campylobacter ureolyticus]|uniref:hypothetical protein n=1 Tax=Campylobacter ureolyticus TaxID=827 RepID=UPI0029137D5E|nr:hypothetical protein [Campylobacter ureolyticus]MDU5325363.1 hypothetical protein [Campylobacter ureolyticus]